MDFPESNVLKKCWRNGKLGNPWSDRSSRSSLIWVYSICLDLLVQKLGSIWYSFLFSERVKFAHNHGRSEANQDGYQGGGDWERSDWDCRLYWNNNVLIRYTLTTFVFYASSYITSTIHIVFFFDDQKENQWETNFGSYLNRISLITMRIY